MYLCAYIIIIIIMYGRTIYKEIRIHYCFLKTVISNKIYYTKAIRNKTGQAHLIILKQAEISFRRGDVDDQII